MRYLFVDPSVNNIGLALFNKQGDILRFKEVKTPRKLDWRTRVSWASEQVELFLDEDDPKSVMVVMETPIYFSGGRGHYAYAGEKIQKLYYAVGFYRAWFSAHGYAVEEVKVSDVRKNLPKAATTKRVERVYGHVPNSEHVNDAIFLAMWWGKKKGLWDLAT